MKPNPQSVKGSLRKREDVERVFRRGERRRRGGVTVLCSEGNGEGVRLCVMVGRKAGSAVRRNRMKRVVREEVRRQVGEGAGDMDVVVVFRGEIGRDSYGEARELVGGLMKAVIAGRERIT